MGRARNLEGSVQSGGFCAVQQIDARAHVAQRAGRDRSRVERSRGVEGSVYGDCARLLPEVTSR